jgi:hypothetical protein
VARLRKHRIDTAFATESGKTMVVSTAKAKDNDAQDADTYLVLVAPTVLDGAAHNDRPAGRTAE